MQAQDIFMICSMTSNTSMMGHLYILSIYNFKLVIGNKMSIGTRDVFITPNWKIHDSPF